MSVKRIERLVKPFIEHTYNLLLFFVIEYMRQNFRIGRRKKLMNTAAPKNMRLGCFQNYTHFQRNFLKF